MSCHTWVYKRIDSMSREEINQEIDCVINERLSRAYMSEMKMNMQIKWLS